MTVYFFNTEAIDINSIAIMGVSVKTGDSPIGFFGTGLKFAIATLLRNGCKITLIRNGEKIPFSVVNEEIRGETFERVVMADERLGFTTKLGRTWEPWQAYRELYCNCLDEGGQITTTAPVGEWGTIFLVEGEAIENCHRNKREIFLDTPPAASDAYCEIHVGSTISAFYRGVKAHKHQMPALFTYNIKAALNLTEDRTVKETYWLNHYIGRLIPTIDDEDIIEQIVLAGNGTFEQRLDLDHAVKPSQAFMRVCYRNRHNAHANQSAIKLWEKNAETRLTYEQVEIDSYEETILSQAVILLDRLQCPIERDDFIVVSNLGENIYGMVRANQILIAKRTFDMGHRFLASTLYEEWLHKSEHFEDESRDLQNFLFEKLFSMTERVTIMENRGHSQLQAAE